MKYPKGCPTHMCAPKEWRQTPNITGSFELDAVIHHSQNKDMVSRLAFYAGDMRGFAVDGDRANAYGPLTGYDAYDGYSGDN